MSGRIDNSTSQFLDAARWISALAVLVSHACGLLLISPDHATEPSAGLQVYFFLRNGGHLAVVIFFVVSGFLVGGQELVRLLDGRHFDARRYAIQRFSRIYVVLVPALFATAMLDAVGQACFNDSLLYTTSAAQGIDSLKYVIADRHDAATLVGNLLMLQTIIVAPFGGNGPLWSLANEWWYYVIFGLVLVSLSGSRPPVQRFAALGAGLVILSVMPMEIGLWFSLWLVGVGAAILDRVWRGLALGRACCVMLLGFAVSLYGMTWPDTLQSLPPSAKETIKFLLDAVAALSFALVMISAKNTPWRDRRRVHQTLAGFSYTLYVVHFPVLVFLGALAHDWFGIELASVPRLSNVLLAAAFVLIAGAVAWALAMVTERHTSTARDALTRLMPRMRSLG